MQRVGVLLGHAFGTCNGGARGHGGQGRGALQQLTPIEIDGVGHGADSNVGPCKKRSNVKAVVVHDVWKSRMNV